MNYQNFIYFLGSNPFPVSSVTISFCFGLLRSWILLLSSSVASSILIGNLINCLGSGYLIVIVLPSGNTAVVGYILENLALLILVTAHRFVFKYLTWLCDTTEYNMMLRTNFELVNITLVEVNQ